MGPNMDPTLAEYWAHIGSHVWAAMGAHVGPNKDPTGAQIKAYPGPIVGAFLPSTWVQVMAKVRSIMGPNKKSVPTNLVMGVDMTLFLDEPSQIYAFRLGNPQFQC
jgi:hypothetical protein